MAASKAELDAARNLEQGEPLLDRDLDRVERALAHGVTRKELGFLREGFREARIRCVRQALAAYLFSDRQRSFPKRAGLYVRLGVVDPQEVSRREEDQEELRAISETCLEMSAGECRDLTDVIQAAEVSITPLTV